MDTSRGDGDCSGGTGGSGGGGGSGGAIGATATGDPPSPLDPDDPQLWAHPFGPCIEGNESLTESYRAPSEAEDRMLEAGRLASRFAAKSMSDGGAPARAPAVVSTAARLCVFAHVDRVGFRVPDEVSELHSDAAESTGGSSTGAAAAATQPASRLRKRHMLQRSLTPHLDCCPADLHYGG